MKIYNETKTKELNENELDFEKGYLQRDKLFIAHHEATPLIKGKSAEEKVEELRAQGITVEQYDSQPGKFYIVTKIYDNGGKEVAEIEADPDEEAKEAYDDYEDIYVYVPYTAEELTERANKKRHAELKAELAKIKEDIEQETFGLVREDFAEKKARAAEIVNELRVLEGKEPREVKPKIL